MKNTIFITIITVNEARMQNKVSSIMSISIVESFRYDMIYKYNIEYMFWMHVMMKCSVMMKSIQKKKSGDNIRQEIIRYFCT